MSAREDVFIQSESPQDPALLLFTDIPELIPDPWNASNLSPVIMPRPVDFDATKAYVRTDDAKDYLRRRICLYSGLDSWFSSQGMEPLDIGDEIENGPLGKPRLRRMNGQKFEFFNMSTRSDALLIGLSAECHIGVDLEDTRRSLLPSSIRAVMKYYFNPSEKLIVESDTLDKKKFLSIWTVKEAAVKALGLSIGSHGYLADSCSVPWLEHDGHRVNGTSDGYGDHLLWSVALENKIPADIQVDICPANALLYRS